MKRILAYVPLFFWVGLIFVFSSMSDPPIPEQVEYVGGDFTLHMVAFFVMGLASAYATATRRGLFDRWSQLEAWSISMVYGALDEFHQWFVPHRHVDGRDLLADALGALMAIWVFDIVAKRIYKRTI